MRVPRVSVVMPVYNERPFIEDSVASILGQTFHDFEFVIGDNGSTDGTRERLEEWRKLDSRIRLLEHPERMGPARSSNWVVRNSQADLVARMDGDDIAHPDRIAQQVRALEREPRAELVGTLFDAIDEDGHRVRPPLFHLLRSTTASPPFCHPTILFKRSAFERIGGYRVEADYWEDVDLFWRLASGGSVFVLASVLLTVRFTTLSSRTLERPELVEEAIDTFYRARTAFEAGLDWIQANEPVGQFPAGRSQRLLPQVFASRAATAVWAGRRAKTLRRMLQRSAFRLNRNSAASLAYVLWATVSPHTLRAALIHQIGRLNQGAEEDGSEVIQWRPKRRTPLA